MVQVLLLGSQHDDPAFEPPWHVHCPLVHMWLVLQVWFPLPPPVPPVGGLPQAKRMELTATNITVRRAVMGRFVPHALENAPTP